MEDNMKIGTKVRIVSVGTEWWKKHRVGWIGTIDHFFSGTKYIRVRHDTESSIVSSEHVELVEPIKLKRCRPWK